VYTDFTFSPTISSTYLLITGFSFSGAASPPQITSLYCLQSGLIWTINGTIYTESATEEQSFDITIYYIYDGSSQVTGGF
jgi:hypothetical protein